jgi:hypothetical protein
MTWLSPDAMLASAIAAMRNVDLPMTLPSYVEAFAWALPIRYVFLTLILSASFLAAFRKPFLLIVVPVIVVFHFLNAVTLYALFLSTMVVASVVLLPYDYLLPTIKSKLVPLNHPRLNEGRAMQPISAGTRMATLTNLLDSSRIETGCEIVRFSFRRPSITREWRGQGRDCSISDGTMWERSA